MTNLNIPELYIWVPERPYYEAMIVYLRLRGMKIKKDDAIIKACLQCNVHTAGLEYYIRKNEERKREQKRQTRLQIIKELEGYGTKVD